MGGKIFVRPCYQGAHSVSSHRNSQDIREACHCGAHINAMPSDAYHDQQIAITINISSKKTFI